MDRGSISANASNSGNAGNIVIDARGIFRMDDSAVTTKATQSSGVRWAQWGSVSLRSFCSLNSSALSTTFGIRIHVAPMDY